MASEEVVQKSRKPVEITKPAPSASSPLFDALIADLKTSGAKESPAQNQPVDELMALAEAASQSRQHTVAIAYFEAVRDLLGPATPVKALVGLEKAIEAAKRLDVSERAFEGASAFDAADTGPAVERGNLLMSTKKWVAAAAHWSATIDRFGEATPRSVYVGAASAFQHLRDFVRFGEVVEAGLSRFPDDSALRGLQAEVSMSVGRWKEALTQWTLLAADEGRTLNAKEWRLYCRAARRSGDRDGARRLAEEGLARYPAHVGLRSEYAETMMEGQRWHDAQLQWESILATSDSASGPVSVGVYKGLATALRMQGELGAARAITEAGVGLFPDDFPLAVEIAEIETAASNWGPAAEKWRSAIALWTSADVKPGYALYQERMCLILSDLGAYSQALEQHRVVNGSKRFGSLKIAVYTAIVDGYDEVKLPLSFSPSIDLHLFTNTNVPDVGAYAIHPITYFHHDKTRTARFAKTHPHLLLPEYDIAIWMDGNVMIDGDIDALVADFLASGKAFAAFPHPNRRTVREELRACMNLNKDESKVMNEQVADCEARGWEASDLIESNVLFCDLRNKDVRLFLDDWWAMIERGSRRDQLSLPYALKKHDIDWLRLSEPPSSARNHAILAVVPHALDSSVSHEVAQRLESVTPDLYAGPSYRDVRDARLEAMTPVRIDIVVCVHNALEDVSVCLDSIERKRTGDHQRLIIIDDASNSETAQFLSEFTDKREWAELHRNEVAVGYSRAANQGLEASTGDLVILLNSDTVVTDRWADKMADAVFSTHGAGLVGPMSSAASHQSIPNHKGGKNQTAINDLPAGMTADDMNRFCEAWTVDGVLPSVPLVHGFCFGVTRAVLDAVGLLDSASFPRGYGEENDYCFRVADSGFGLVIATHTYIYHAKSKSFATAEREKLMKDGSAKLREIHSRNRVMNAVKSMEANPLLIRMRDAAGKLYDGGNPA